MATFFDNLFGGGSQAAAGAQQAGLTAGYNQAVPLIQQGLGEAKTDYAAALKPYTTLFNTAQPATDLYARLTGAAPGSSPDTINQTLAGLPGINFALTRGTQAVDRGAAAKGLLQSGGTINAEQQNAENLANQYYFNYLAALNPLMSTANTAAGGIAANRTGLGNLTAGTYGNLGNLAYNTQAGIGNAIAAGDLGQQAAQQSFFGNMLNLGAKLVGAGGGIPGLGGGGMPGNVGATAYGGPGTFTGSGLYLG